MSYPGLSASVGYYNTPDDQSDDVAADMLPHLMAGAMEAAEAGVVFSWAEWVAQSPIERAILREAYERVAARRAAAIGAASQSAEGAARILSRDDGGAAMVDAAMRSTLDKLKKIASEGREIG